MQKVSGPTLYIARFYWTERNRRQTNSFISLLDWTLLTFRTKKMLILARSCRPLSITAGDLCFTSLPPTAFVFDHFCLSLLCWGPEAVFGFVAGASTWCSGPEMIMWAASQLRLEDTLDVNRRRGESPAAVTSYFGVSWVYLSHLMLREGCPHMRWQTGDLTPVRQWSSWGGCSDHQKNFFEVTPENIIKWRH